MLEYLILNNRIEAAYKYSEISPRSFKEELLGHFAKGKRAEFLRLFGLLRREDKLEFYLRVYFLIHSIHPALKAKPAIPDEEINAFREFLDSQGGDLAKTNEFLEFYALPFVKKPLEHASYKTLFKKEWVSNLTEKLQLYLQEEERRMKEAVSTLLKEEGEGRKLREQSESRKLRSPQFAPVQPPVPFPALRQLQQKNKKLLQQLQLVKGKFSGMERDYNALMEGYKVHLMESQNKWFQITRELTNNSRTLIELIAKSNSNLINDRKYQRVKRRTEKFQRMVRKELDQLMNQSQDLSIFDKPSVNEISHSASFTPNISQRNVTTFVSIDEFVPTNYVLLMREFKRMGAEQQVKVLQGFSWRIIKSKNRWVRRQTIVGLIVNDVLGLMNGDIQTLLFNEQLMIYVLRLFLYISEDLYGSKVLFRNGGLYKEIIDLIPEILREKKYQCLAVILQILENIWHNKEILLELINLNIIDICVNVLLEDEAIRTNDDLLESIVTLLLNATALKEGLDSFQTQINIFFSLSEAFREANDSNRNLIGAIIYGLLGREEMWRLAHEAKLPTFIDDLLKMDFRSNKQQLVLLQQKLHRFESGKTIESEDYQDESFDSNLEEEIFERNEEQLTDLEEFISGHDMLTNKYSLRGKEADKQIDEINKIMEQFKSKSQEQTLKERREVAEKERINHRNQEKEKMQNVRLPDIKQKKEQSLKKEQPLKKEEPHKREEPHKKEESHKKDESHKKEEPLSLPSQKQQAKTKVTEQKEYYSYKSPNFKQADPKNSYSLQIEKELASVKQRIHSFEVQKEDPPEDRRISRVQTKPTSTKPNDSLKTEEREKRNPDKRSSDKPEYRIKKSSSVEKGLGLGMKKPVVGYQTNKNNSNIEYMSIEGVKSPPPKRTREEVLRQLNEELRAEKKVEQERKVSTKNLPANSSPAQRENNLVKKQNNFVAPTQEQSKAFASRPKIRRTPPKDDEQE